MASVRTQTVPALETILVIDHNPALLARAERELEDVIVLPNTGGKGASGGRNSGVAASRGEVVAFLDDDAVASPLGSRDCSGISRTPMLSALAASSSRCGRIPARAGFPASSTGRWAPPTGECPRKPPLCATCGAATWRSVGRCSTCSRASASTSVRSAGVRARKTRTCACVLLPRTPGAPGFTSLPRSRSSRAAAAHDRWLLPPTVPQRGFRESGTGRTERREREHVGGTAIHPARAAQGDPPRPAGHGTRRSLRVAAESRHRGRTRVRGSRFPGGPGDQDF